jgi:hypothetical protein
MNSHKRKWIAPCGVGGVMFGFLVGGLMLGKPLEETVVMMMAGGLGAAVVLFVAARLGLYGT